MKFLLVLLVVVGMGWWLFGRGAGRSEALRKRGKAQPPQVTAMVQCAHCGVHLPQGDAVFDGVTPYCGEPHRLAGPRPR